jgi:hypothetical protein
VAFLVGRRRHHARLPGPAHILQQVRTPSAGRPSGQ